MVTVSIKGLTREAYAVQQGIKNPGLFDNVLENLKRLSYIRRNENPNMLLGVASLVLPENSGTYLDMITLFHEIGADYVYFNQVEPSLKRWGISFTEDEQAETLKAFESYAKQPFRDMTVRCAANPFQEPSGGVYYDAAALRENSDICGSALFNPLVLSDGSEARWFACRNSGLFTDTRFSIGELSADGMEPIMGAAAGCRECRLERQVKHIDKVISVERMYNGKGNNIEYYLVFDRDKLAAGGYAFLQFDQIVK